MQSYKKNAEYQKYLAFFFVETAGLVRTEPTGFVSPKCRDGIFYRLLKFRIAKKRRIPKVFSFFL